MSNIIEDLRPLAVPVKNLKLDPDNANQGDLERVRNSLQEFGQRKPVVVRRTGKDRQGRGKGVVEAGNTTLQAAIALGWTEIAAVFVTEDETRARGFAITDNRTGQLAVWDLDQLVADLHAMEQEFDLAELGWNPGDVDELIRSAGTYADQAASFLDGDDQADGTGDQGDGGGDEPPADDGPTYYQLAYTVTFDGRQLVNRAIGAAKEQLDADRGEDQPRATSAEALVHLAGAFLQDQE